MKAVIIAAGEGKRLRPLTLDKPKQLVLALGKPLIQYVWDVLPKEIDEVIIVVGYKGNMIQEFLGTEYMGKKITYIEQYQPLGTARAFKLCKSHLINEEKFLVMYADDIHGKEGVAKLVKHDAALLVSPVADPRNFGVVVKNDDGTVKNIEEKPEHPKSNLAATGVYMLNPKIFNYDIWPTHNGEYYLTDMIERYIHENTVHIEESDLWIPIAYPHDIVRAEEILLGIDRAVPFAKTA